MSPFTKDCMFVGTKSRENLLMPIFFWWDLVVLKIVRKFHFGYVACDHSCGIGDKSEFLLDYMNIYIRISSKLFLLASLATC